MPCTRKSRARRDLFKTDSEAWLINSQPLCTIQVQGSDHTLHGWDLTTPLVDAQSITLSGSLRIVGDQNRRSILAACGELRIVVGPRRGAGQWASQRPSVTTSGEPSGAGAAERREQTAQARRRIMPRQCRGAPLVGAGCWRRTNVRSARQMIGPIALSSDRRVGIARLHHKTKTTGLSVAFQLNSQGTSCAIIN